MGLQCNMNGQPYDKDELCRLVAYWRSACKQIALGCGHPTACQLQAWQPPLLSAYM